MPKFSRPADVTPRTGEGAPLRENLAFVGKRPQPLAGRLEISAVPGPEPVAKTEDLARRLLEKAYDKPLFSPSELKKPLSDVEVRKIFSGLFGKER